MKMNLNNYLRTICKQNKYLGLWTILDLQNNLAFIIGEQLSKYCKPIQIRVNNFQQNTLVMWVKPMMIFEIKSQEFKIKQSINLYLAQKVIHNIIFITKMF